MPSAILLLGIHSYAHLRLQISEEAIKGYNDPAYTPGNRLDWLPWATDEMPPPLSMRAAQMTLADILGVPRAWHELGSGSAVSMRQSKNMFYTLRRRTREVELELLSN